MSACVDLHLLGEICTVKHGQSEVVGRIDHIGPYDFIIHLLEEEADIATEKYFKIIIETMDHEVFFLDAIRRNHPDPKRLVLKPLSEVHSVNNRNSPRWVFSIHSDPVAVGYRLFPPRCNAWEPGVLWDIGSGGVRFHGHNFICRGELIEMKISPPLIDTDEIVIGRVVDVTKGMKGYQFSVQFLNMHERHRMQIEEYITHKKAEMLELII